MKESLKEQLSQVIREVLAEKKLTKSQIIARDKEEKDIKKKNPKMPEGEAYGIATKNVEKKKAVKEDLDSALSKLVKDDDASELVALIKNLPNAAREKVAQMLKINLSKEEMDEARFPKGTDIGKKGPGFKAVEKAAEKEYGSKEAGKKVAGAILKKVIKK